ncbi:hypothetical protein OROMI_021786 [Orobanche minor]
MENRQVSPLAEPSSRRASVDEIPYDASTRTEDVESREDADVLAAAREASSRDEAEKVVVEKRKREVDEISEVVTKKVKAEIQSPESIQMLENAIVSLLPRIASTGAGGDNSKLERRREGYFWKSMQELEKSKQIDGRTSRENEASTDNEALTSSHIQKGLMLEQPLWSQLPNTQEIAAEFAWNYDIHHNVFGGESPYSTQETQSSIPTTSKAVEDVWKAMHGEKPEGWVPDHKTEEVIPAEHVEHLEQFAEGLLPEWGGLKKWIEAEKLVLLCYFDITKHWAVCTIHFKTCMVILWDSNEHKFNDHIRMLRKNALLPLHRILPQLLKHMGYYISNPVPHKYTEWPLYFPLNSANKLHHRDIVSCGPLALKSMENRLADIPDKMMYKKNLPSWSAHIAETIYNYSTHERTIAD